jgi:hypothetical protein
MEHKRHGIMDSKKQLPCTTLTAVAFQKGGVHWIAVYKFVLVFKGSNLRKSKHLKFPSFWSRCSPQLQTGTLWEPEHKAKFH